MKLFICWLSVFGLPAAAFTNILTDTCANKELDNGTLCLNVETALTVNKYDAHGIMCDKLEITTDKLQELEEYNFAQESSKSNIDTEQLISILFYSIRQQATTNTLLDITAVKISSTEESLTYATSETFLDADSSNTIYASDNTIKHVPSSCETIIVTSEVSTLSTSQSESKTSVPMKSTYTTYSNIEESITGIIDDIPLYTSTTTVDGDDYTVRITLSQPNVYLTSTSVSEYTSIPGVVAALIILCAATLII
ncbi:hypothetical protein COEREDRAFT_88557 [Coemansia reversa NRRL 1564]|uniref:Uncharacterized protein n=1 Tax=Coemansia reversa (strain ATCC 12441 / NRRL 1564) TaxID=763665 RepID=A0A2G5B6B1_COERN|nr:hypothetical protein COEREDRAFT_88557 [Coemansia reversa NRRL 1564]|eukprot:PIA14583.1 hypothetical protein COEREDRAFT_88557 [Coemansia reversa NRRL 1564]